MKSLRQMTILEIIQKQDIETQEQLTDALKREGIVTTQATVSRDIKEMRLAKVLAQSGVYKYAVPDRVENDMKDRMSRMLSDSVLNFQVSGSTIVIHTLSAAAGAAAEILDAMRWPEVLGTIAGDNTIFMVISEDADPHKIAERLQSMMQ